MFHFSLRALAGAVTAIALACAALTYASPWMASLAWTVTVLGLALAAVAAVLSTSKRRGFWTGFAIVGWLYTLVTVSPMLGELQGSLFTTTLLQRAAGMMPQATTLAATPPPAYYAPTTSYVVAPAVTATTPVYAPPPTSSMPTQLGFGGDDATAAAPATSSMPTYNPQPLPAPVAPLTSTYPVYPVTTYTPGQSGYQSGYYAPSPASQFTESFVQIGQALWVLAFALAGGLLGQCLVARQSRAAPSASN